MLALSAFLVVLVAAGCQARHFNNPVLDNADYPDPGVILHEGVYYAVTTTNNNEWEKYPIHRSTDLQNWEFVGHVFNQTNFPKYACQGCEFWAPEIHRIVNEFHAIFTTKHVPLDKLVIGVAKASRPEGPYTCLDEPLLADPPSIFDSTIIKLQDGKMLLAWVEENSVMVGNLSADGLRVTDDVRVKLITPTAPWEESLTEGPWYLFRNGYHYIFYSAPGMCTDKYALGVGRSRNILGPYEKLPNPILVSSDDFKGPGHGSILPDTKGVEGQDYVYIHHAWKANQICDNGYVRIMCATSLTFASNDWPNQMHIGD